MKKKNVTIVSTIFVIVGMLVTFTHCGMPGSELQSSQYGADATYPTDANHSSVGGSVNPDTEEGQLTLETVDVGIKGFEQILVSMSQVTGVDYKSSRIQSLYAQVENQLPTSNSVKSFSASNQVAIMKLASEFCNEVIRSSTLRSNLWPSTNFGSNPSTAYNTANRERFIEESLENFYPHLTEQDNEYMEYGQELESLINDLVGSMENNSTTTRNIAFGACTTLLASLEMTAI